MSKISTLLAFLFLTLVSCVSKPVARFTAVDVDIQNMVSHIELYADSTGIQFIDDDGSTIKEHWKWRGSLESGSTLLMYIDLEDGTRLSSVEYKVDGDTLRLIEWSIQ